MEAGDWVGRIIHLTGRYMDAVYTVQHSAGETAITLEVDTYGPFEFTDIRATDDSLSFKWEPSFELECTLARLPDGVYQGACMDPWGGFGGIVMAPPGSDVDAIVLNEHTIESIAGWIEPPAALEALAPNYPEGEFATVDGVRTNYVAAGSGPVTVVFMSGLGDDLTGWEGLQRRLTGLTRTVSYDRPGLGRSNGTEAPRTPEQLAIELRGLLRTADIPPPYVIVAHAESALAARRFADLYKQSVQSLVLIDPHLEAQAAMWRMFDESGWDAYWDRRKTFNSQLSGALGAEFRAYASVLDAGIVQGLSDTPPVPTHVIVALRAIENSTQFGSSSAGRQAWNELHQSWVGRAGHLHLWEFDDSASYVHQEVPDRVAFIIGQALQPDG